VCVGGGGGVWGGGGSVCLKRNSEGGVSFRVQKKKRENAKKKKKSKKRGEKREKKRKNRIGANQDTQHTNAVILGEGIGRSSTLLEKFSSGRGGRSGPQRHDGVGAAERRGKRLIEGEEMLLANSSAPIVVGECGKKRESKGIEKATRQASRKNLLRRPKREALMYSH